MLNSLKSIIKSILPESLLRFIRPYYHGALALLANLVFGQPSNKLIVIGVTGTAGKSTTIAMLAHILNGVGKKTGYITTVNFFDGESSYINKHGMSMPGGWLLQKQLHLMLRNNCHYAIIECTSEGLAQNRHLGINFDLALFTNLSPAHLDSHGGFENYKRAKALLFQTLSKHSVTPSKLATDPHLQKTIITNIDNEFGTYYLNFKATKHITIAVQNKTASFVPSTTKALESGIEYKLENTEFHLFLIGAFNIYNALIATAAANALGVDLAQSSMALKTFSGTPGRMEKIPNNRGINIFVDYAPEPAGMEQVLLTLSSLPHKKIIHVFGSTGGSRDVAKRFEFGTISAKYSDTVIITNDDVYDSDPGEIASNIEEGINRLLKDEKKATEILTILDRREAIRKALNLAAPGDLVIITGKGSEQFLILPGNERISWDDRAVVREELRNLQK